MSNLVFISHFYAVEIVQMRRIIETFQQSQCAVGASRV